MRAEDHGLDWPRPPSGSAPLARHPHWLDESRHCSDACDEAVVLVIETATEEIAMCHTHAVQLFQGMADVLSEPEPKEKA